MPDFTGIAKISVIKVFLFFHRLGFCPTTRIIEKSLMKEDQSDSTENCGNDKFTFDPRPFKNQSKFNSG